MSLLIMEGVQIGWDLSGFVCGTNLGTKFLGFHKSQIIHFKSLVNGAGNRARTDDLLITNVLLVN
jgi:hypothetical protein